VNVLLTSASLLPSYGGPAFSVSRLATSLADAGVSVGLWAADQSARSTPLLGKGTPVERIVGTEWDALCCFDRVDVLHDNGIWLAYNHRLAILAERRGIPRIVSTRGMLEPWALAHKRLKKRLAWRLYQQRDLGRARYHHTTAETEARNLSLLRLGVPIITVPNGVDVPDETASDVHQQSETRAGRPKIAFFLGRVYPIKGLLTLIQAWARVRPRNWCLRIAGPDEAGHRKEVERAAAAAGIAESVSFIGEVAPKMKQSEFSKADLFVLPSYSESFGMAVAEALAHGLPVLTTTGTPWSTLQQNGCGWWVEPTTDGLAAGLRAATALERDALRAMGAKGRQFVRAQFSWRYAAERLVAAYQILTGIGANNFCTRTAS